MRLLIRYTRQRLVRPVVLAAVLLVSMGAAIIRIGDGLSIVSSIGPATLLVVAFRMADDIADRERDRERHPDRAVVQAEFTAPLAIAGATVWSGAAALAAVARGPSAVVMLVLFTIALTIWYRSRGIRSASGDRILLLKYPVFTIVTAGVPPSLTPSGLFTLAVVYLAACVYEWAHDADSPATRRERSIEAALLAGACIALILSLGGIR
jgi:hypothetical protein